MKCSSEEGMAKGSPPLKGPVFDMSKHAVVSKKDTTFNDSTKRTVEVAVDQISRAQIDDMVDDIMYKNTEKNENAMSSENSEDARPSESNEQDAMSSENNEDAMSPENNEDAKSSQGLSTERRRSKDNTTVKRAATMSK